MKKFMSMSLMAVVLCVPMVSHAVANERNSWKDQPREKFTESEKSFQFTMDNLLKNYVDKGLSKDDLYRAATAGMLEALNSGEHSWNTLMSPGEVSNLQADLSGQISGIGIGIKFEEGTGYIEVLNVMANSPASKAGIKREDRILSIDGNRFKGKKFLDAVNAIRGKVGESVALKVLREDGILSLNVKREAISWTPVDLTKIDDATELLTIGYFTVDTPKLVEEKMGVINAKGMKNLIIDLRGNSGGGFEQAVQTAELFIPNGEAIVSTKDREGKVQTFTSKKGLLKKDIKVVVLTNGATSSGAELFAGALKDDLGAKTIGETTLGKWNAQRVEMLPNGFAIKYTTEGFESPQGHTYQNVGLRPDVEIPVAKEFEPRELAPKYDIAKRLTVDPQLKAAAELVRGM